MIDDDARFEECNGENRPLTAAEYAENEYMGCPVHPRGDKSHDRTENGRAWCQCGREYAPVPYAEYLAYYGNPEMHVYLGCEVAPVCRCCGAVGKTVESLWNIDFMIDGREYEAITLGQWMSEAETQQLPGYAAEVARELLAEAREQAEQEAR